jgi:hypothetical protein
MKNELALSWQGQWKANDRRVALAIRRMEEVNTNIQLRVSEQNGKNIGYDN